MTEPTTAPRGKAFAVFRYSHVVGTDVHLVRVPGEWKERAEADQVARHIDWRLSPTVALVSLKGD